MDDKTTVKSTSKLEVRVIITDDKGNVIREHDSAGAIIDRKAQIEV
jgi:hypothetical protein